MQIKGILHYHIGNDDKQGFNGLQMAQFYAQGHTPLDANDALHFWGQLFTVHLYSSFFRKARNVAILRSFVISVRILPCRWMKRYADIADTSDWYCSFM